MPLATLQNLVGRRTSEPASAPPLWIDGQEIPVELKRNVRARRIILESVPQIEDLLASGADATVLAERTDMEAGSIEWNVEVFEGVAAYTAFRSAAATAQPGDFADVVELDDGGLPDLEGREDRRFVLLDGPAPFGVALGEAGLDGLQSN